MSLYRFWNWKMEEQIKTILLLPTLANFLGSVLSPLSVSRHMTTLRSAKLLGLASHFICLQPLYEIRFHSPGPPSNPTASAWVLWMRAEALGIGGCGVGTYVAFKIYNLCDICNRGGR